MAWQTEPATTTDVPNYVGTLLWTGYQFGVSPLLSLKGFTGGVQIATGSLFPMTNLATGDAPSQSAVTEDNQIATPSYTSVTSSQTTQNMQAYYRAYVVSYAAQALSQTISGVALNGEVQLEMASLDVQREAGLKQLASDWEYSALYGTSQAWTNAATAGAMGGLLTAVEAGSETAAAGAPLSTDLIDTEVVRMSAAGARFENMVISCGAFQFTALNNLYGNAIRSVEVAGMQLKRILIPVMGECFLLYNPAMATDDLAFVDLNHFFPVFGQVPGMPNVIVAPLPQIGAGSYEFIYALISVNYHDIQYHGMVSGLATS